MYITALSRTRPTATCCCFPRQVVSHFTSCAYKQTTYWVMDKLSTYPKVIDVYVKLYPERDVPQLANVSSASCVSFYKVYIQTHEPKRYHHLKLLRCQVPREQHALGQTVLFNHKSLDHTTDRIHLNLIMSSYLQPSIPCHVQQDLDPLCCSCTKPWIRPWTRYI